MMWRTNCTHDATVPRMSPHRILVQFAVVAMVVGVVAACGDADVATSSSTTAKADSSTSTAAKDANGDGSQGVDEPTWDTDAQPKRGRNGETFSIVCPPDGQPSQIWGAGTYTDDSSICAAAVQSGLITFASGGSVKYTIAPGQGSYEAGQANGVESSGYGAWSGSFTLPEAADDAVTIATGPESWSRTATALGGEVGDRLTVRCSAGGTAASVWGSGPYTADSSICTAGVHAGLITIADGGTVVIEVAAGQESYEASDANGVSTSSYGSYGSSFTFPQDQTPG